MIEKVYHFLCGLTSAFAAFFPKVQRGKKKRHPAVCQQGAAFAQGF